MVGPLMVQACEKIPGCPRHRYKSQEIRSFRSSEVCAGGFAIAGKLRGGREQASTSVDKRWTQTGSIQFTGHFSHRAELVSLRSFLHYVGFETSEN